MSPELATFPPSLTAVPESPPAVSERARRRMTVLLVVVAAVVVCYWALWYGHRSLVASETRPGYYEFENAFPVADGWLVVTLVAGAWTLSRRRPVALGWLLAGAGAGLYLFSMDVLYDLEHGIWGRGSAGLVELAVNAATLVLSLGVGGWAWRRRTALLGGDPAGNRAVPPTADPSPMHVTGRAPVPILRRDGASTSEEGP